MEYFSKGLKSVLSPRVGEETQINSADTIDRLCDRITSSTLLDDRRDAVKAIRSLSKKYKLEVGTKSMDLLMNLLQTDRNDNEIVGLALDTLCNVMTTDSADESAEFKQNLSIADAADLGNQFTEIFLKNPENLTTLLSLLEEYDFKVRWPTVKLLTILLQNRGLQIQQCVLVSPLGVSRLMDLLSDSREVIRNDGLLLLIQMTRGNAAIQKIVAFENAFDRLLEIISEEGYSDGGIVVEDCLLLLSILLKGNVSNQTLFREGSFTQRLKSFFEFSSAALTDEAGWQPNKISNVQRMLQLLQILVSPANPPQGTLSFQKVMSQCGLLKCLCDILMASGIPADILTETVTTVAEVIRGCQSNQDYFSEVNAPAASAPARQAIVILLMSMINEKQPFNLRRSVLYCFQCYLYKNQKGQSQIISTLLPSTSEANVVTAGQLLCAGLFSPDSFSNWCASTALAHALKGNKEMKEQLLRVQLATGVGSAPISLLQQCLNMLSQGSKCVQTRAGLLAFLASWLHGCPIAVTHLLQNTASIPFLAYLKTLSKMKLCEAVKSAEPILKTYMAIWKLISIVTEHGNGKETVVEGLAAILIGVCIVYNDNEVETFSKDEIKRIITTRIEIERFLTKIDDVTQTEFYTSALKSTQIQSTSAEEVLFDFEFVKLFKKLEGSISKALQTDNDEEDNEQQTQDSTSQGHGDHNAIVTSYKELIRQQDEELHQVRNRCSDFEAKYSQAQQQLIQQAMELTQLRSQVEMNAGVSQETGESEDQSSVLQDQLKKLHLEISNRDEEIASLKGTLSSNQSQLEMATMNATVGEVLNLESTEHDKRSLQISNETMIELDRMRELIHTLESENNALRTQSPLSVDERIMKLEDELRAKKEAFDQQKQDYEDLLVLLDDQDAKVEKYKSQLVQLGVKIEDQEDEDLDDDDNDEIGSGSDSGVLSVDPIADVANNGDLKMDAYGESKPANLLDLDFNNQHTADTQQQLISTSSSSPNDQPISLDENVIADTTTPPGPATPQRVNQAFFQPPPTQNTGGYPNDYLFGIPPPKASDNNQSQSNNAYVNLDLFGGS